MKKIKIILILLAFQINNTNTAQEEKVSELYQPTSLQELSLTQVGPQLIDILMLSLTHNIDLNDLSLAENVILEEGLTYDQPYSKFINSYTTPSKKLSLLDIAIICNNTQITDYLLRAGAHVNKVDKNNGATPLIHAINQDAIDVIPLLLEAGANINQSDRYQRTPLFTAIKNGEINIIQLLLAAGVDVNKPNNIGDTPLIEVIIFNKSQASEIIPLLLEAGADPNKANHAGDTPLSTAIIMFALEVISILEDAGAKLAIK